MCSFAAAADMRPCISSFQYTVYEERKERIDEQNRI